MRAFLFLLLTASLCFGYVIERADTGDGVWVDGQFRTKKIYRESLDVLKRQYGELQQWKDELQVRWDSGERTQALRDDIDCARDTYTDYKNRYDALKAEYDAVLAWITAH